MTSKADINKLVDEEIQKCLREKVREIINDKLAKSTKYIEKIVIEHIDSLVPRSIEDKTIESYDVIYDTLSNLNKNDIDDASIIYSTSRMKATCINTAECKIMPSFLDINETLRQEMKESMKPTLFIVKYPSEEDPSTIVKTYQKGKTVSINTIINNTCDCDYFKNCKDTNPICMHTEFAKPSSNIFQPYDEEKIFDDCDVV